MHRALASWKLMKGVSIMNDQRVFDMELVKVESLEKAVRTPFYQTDSTVVSVFVLKTGHPLPKHYHHHSDVLWVIFHGILLFSPSPVPLVPFTLPPFFLSTMLSFPAAQISFS